MDQVKIGKFIAACRRKASMTQLQLAEKLNITDRAVSKWETGRAMPDTSIMLELCSLLGVTVNDLLSGEVVTVEHYSTEMEKHLLDALRQKEESDARLLRTEIVMGICCILPFAAATVIVAAIPMQEWQHVAIVLGSLLPLLIALPFALRIEQKAGYYACRHCGHRHVPTYASVFWAMHVNRTRYMRCPQCGKRSWQKKVLRRE